MKSKRAKPIIASELMAQLEKDPEYVLWRKRQDMYREEWTRMTRLDGVDMIKEIHEAGISISSVWDLVNTRDSYPEAISILIKHFNIPHHIAVFEGILRSLMVKEAKGIAGRTILDKLKSWADFPPYPVPYFSESFDKSCLIDSEESYQAAFKQNIKTTRWSMAYVLTMLAEKDMAPEIKELMEDDRYLYERPMLEKIYKRLTRSKSSAKKKSSM